MCFIFSIYLPLPKVRVNAPNTGVRLGENGSFQITECLLFQIYFFTGSFIKTCQRNVVSNMHMNDINRLRIAVFGPKGQNEKRSWSVGDNKQEGINYTCLPQRPFEVWPAFGAVRCKSGTPLKLFFARLHKWSSACSKCTRPNPLLFYFLSLLGTGIE